MWAFNHLRRNKPPTLRTTKATTAHPKPVLLLLEQEVLKMNTAGDEGMKISSLKEERTVWSFFLPEMGNIRKNYAKKWPKQRRGSGMKVPGE